MERQKRHTASHLRSISPKAIGVSNEHIIQTRYLALDQPMPLVIEPTIDDIDPISWLNSNLQFVETKLLEHGAILFRGFPIDSEEIFERFASTMCPELFGEYGDLPRAQVSGKTYLSTPYPADKAILFHNESPQMHQWPLKQWFYCAQPAEEGGETPIVDCRKVYLALPPELRARFAQKQLLYVRNFIPGLDVSWQDFFRTDHKSVVEEYCRITDIDFEWIGDDHLRTKQKRLAVARHPKTGEVAFFNQMLAHHVSCLDPTVREFLISSFGKEKLPRNVYYGDNLEIEDSIVETIRAIYSQLSVSFRWQAKDVLMLDNMLVAHGRMPFTGRRKIVVTMGEMVEITAIDNSWI